MKKERKELGLGFLLLNEGQLPWLPKNPRQWTATDVERTAASIKEDPDFLEDRPLLVVPFDAKNYVVFAGNLRHEGAYAAKRSKVPCVVYYPETEDDQETIRRRAMKDNGSFGSWDWDEVFSSPWGSMDLEALGIGKAFQEPINTPDTPNGEKGGQGEKEPPQAKEDDFDENKDAIKVRCKPGDIWQLGEHRLLCGDSTDAAQVALLMNGEKADLLLTDPPYGVKRDKGFSGARAFGGGAGKKIASRQYDDDWDGEAPSKETFDLICSQAKTAIIFGGNFFTDKLPVNGFWLVWDKHNSMPTFGDCELAWTNIPRKSVKKYDCLYNGLVGKEKERFHPTQKPVKIMADIMADFCKEGHSVLDAFGGSGTTLIAAEQLARKCFMMELDPHYCDIILARWEKLTGRKAEKVKQ